MAEAWPELPYAGLHATAETLQLLTQIVGKVRLARTPWVNHSWHVTLRVSARFSAGCICMSRNSGIARPRCSSASSACPSEAFANARSA